MTITVDACAGYAYAAGLRGDALVTAVAIVGPESGYNEKKHNPDASTGDDSYGLWQINMLGSLGPARRKQFGLKANSDLYDPATNARAMYGISSGGTNWSPWTTFKKGLHRAYLAKAQAAATAVEGRSGGAAATGAPLLEATVLGPVAGERVPPGGGLRAVPPFTAAFPSLSISGSPAARRLVELHGIGGRISLSASSVMEIEMRFIDARRTGLWTHFLPLAGAKYGDLDLIVAAREWTDEDGIEIFVVTLRSAGVHKMRQPDDGHTWANLSPTEVMAERATAAKLRFYGKGSPQRTQIVRLGADDAGRDLAESDWDMGQRLAREEGFWFFESGGALYFAPPTWLAEHGTRFPVRYRSVGSEIQWETLGFPQMRTTVDEIVSSKAIVSSGSMPLPRWRGEQVRPGMVAEFIGTPGFYDGPNPGTPLPMLVTDVSWDLDAGDTPVTVDATTPVDPTPDPPVDQMAMADSTGTAAGGASSTNAAGAGAGGNVSNGGKGSYGYQYDAPGNTAATGPQPGASVLMRHLLAKFTSATNKGIFNDRDVAGTTTKSAHAEGRAGDCGVPVSSVYGKSLADYLVANATLFGIQYVIWDGQSWRAEGGNSPRKWKTYTPPNGQTDNTSMHRDHVHWELCWEAARYLNDRAVSAAYGNS